VQGASQPANPAPQSGSSQEFVAPRAWDPGERPPEKEGCARPSVGVGVNADLALRRGAPALSGCRSGEAPRQGRSFLKKFFWMAMRIPIFQFPRHVITDLLIEGGSLLLHRVSVSILAAAILRDLFGADEEGQPERPQQSLNRADPMPLLLGYLNELPDEREFFPVATECLG